MTQVNFTNEERHLTDEEQYNLQNSEEKEKTGCTGVFDCKGRETTLAQHSPFPRLWSSQDDNDGSNSLAESGPETQPVVLCNY